MTKNFLNQINYLWLQQEDTDWSFMSEVTVCRELGEILEKEGFDFVFSTDKLNGFEGMNITIYQY